MYFDAATTVEQEWNHIHSKLVSANSVYVQICELAREDPKLGRLFPFLGVAGFCFSTVCEYPFFVDVLISHTDDNQFGVYVCSGDGGWVETSLAGEGDSSTCVKLASSILPADYGSAILGDANEWRKLKGIPLIESAYK